MAARYSKTGSFGPCSLNRRDLFRLEEMISIPPGEPGTWSYIWGSQIWVELPGVHITTSSMKSLLEHNELPSTFRDLSIVVRKNNETHDDYNEVTIYLRSAVSNTLNVSGPDNVWVQGEYVHLMAFFAKKKPWYSLLRTTFFCWWLSLIAISDLVIITAARGNRVALVSAGLLLLALVVVFAFVMKAKLWPYTNIYVGPERSRFNAENITAVATVVILFLTAAGVVIGVLTLLRT